jgi:DNA-binding MarR family transcriptional regulator
VAKSRGPHEFLDEAEWQSWNALLLLNRSVLRALDVALRREHRLTVTEFDVLITLYNAPDRRLGMSLLADRALLSPAGTTHLVTRLERDGLVRREADTHDRRKWHAVLTDRGDAALRAARSTHNEVVRRRLLEMTTERERATLSRLWRRLAKRESEAAVESLGGDAAGSASSTGSPTIA